MKHALLLILAAIPLASPAEMYDAEYETCSQSTTIGIVECVDEAGKKWDKRLNTAYQALVQRSEPGQNDALKKAQRLWIRYRDANCGFYAANGGSIGQIEAYECVRAMTKARTCEIDRVNRGDSQPLAECSAQPAPTHAADTSRTADTARTAVSTHTADTSHTASTPHTATTTGSSLAVTLESTLDGIPRQNNASFLSIYNKSPYNRKKPYGDMHTNVHFEQEVSTAGGSAVFGWMEDTKQVVLMTHAKYLPALTLAATSREIEFTHALESVSQAPRYLMTCVWQREDDQIAPALRLYAERDDANSNAKIEKDSQSVLVSWVAVPASRAEKRFAAHDYCAEVAASERSSVPLWEEVLWN